MAVINPTYASVRPNITPRDRAIKRIIQSYRRKILTLYPGASFDDSYMLGCSPEEWADRLQADFNPSMTWENYGTAWVVINQKKRKDVDLRDPAQFYAYFKADQFVPAPNDVLPNWLKNLRKVKGAKPEGFSAPGFPNQAPEKKSINAKFSQEFDA